jgi:hypothetical protein
MCGKRVISRWSIRATSTKPTNSHSSTHKKLDKAVFAAYGWPETLSDEEILEKLLALNLEQAAMYTG